MSNILIIKHGSLGDLIQANGAIQDIKNTFKNVEYNGIYDIDNNFTVKSEEAYILKEDQDVVHMSNMRVTLYLYDGRVVVITSDNGSYNKVTYDCYFVDNVKATDGKTIILAENLDLFATEDSASVYNNVSFIGKSFFLPLGEIEKRKDFPLNLQKKSLENVFIAECVMLPVLHINC